MNTLNHEALTDVPQGAKGSSWTRRSRIMLGCVLLVAAIAILRGVSVGEFSYNVDETQHADTGLFVADLVRDHPFVNPIQYTYRYYAQYPALSGVIHWPPLFYCVGAVFYLLLGSTVVAARLAILFFALAALVFWFCLARELLNEWVATVCTLCLALLPSVLLFEKTVMLEIPLLAFCIASAFFWIRYLEKARNSDIYWFALCASGALLTKQNGVFLIPFCVLSGLIWGGWKFFLRREVLRAAAICFVLTAPYYILAYRVNWQTLAMDLNEKSPSNGMSWLFYWKVLPDQLGWAFLGLALLGIATCRYWGKPKFNGIMLVWIAACYATFTLIGHKEPRYILYWVPPFLYFACGLMLCFFRAPWLKVAGAFAAVTIVGITMASAWSFHRPYVMGYAAVPKKILEVSKSGVVLFDGPLPGNFIFFMRADDPARHFVVLRKALHVSRIKSEGGGLELAHSQEDVERILQEDGVRFVVVSDNFPLHFEDQQLLRSLLKGPAYKELGRFLIQGNDLTPANMSLILYEKLQWTLPSAKYLRIKMLTTGRDIVVPFNGLAITENR